MIDRNEYFENFYDKLVERLEELGQGVAVRGTYPENNRIVKCIKVYSNDDMKVGVLVDPEIYYEDYRKGQPLGSIVNQLISEVRKAHPSEYRTQEERWKAQEAFDQLRTAVVAYEPNKEWLADLPHERVADMAVYLRWEIAEDKSIKVSDVLLSDSMKTKEELFQIAKENTKKELSLEPLGASLKRIAIENGMDAESVAQLFREEETPDIYILTRECCHHGAGLAADPTVLNEVKKILNEDFYILPSSIHEVLIVPDSITEGQSVDDLKNMVMSVNETEVPLRERLTNNVYRFNGKSLVEAQQEIRMGNVMENTLDNNLGGLRHGRGH